MRLAILILAAVLLRADSTDPKERMLTHALIKADEGFQKALATRQRAAEALAAYCKGKDQVAFIAPGQLRPQCNNLPAQTPPPPVSIPNGPKPPVIEPKTDGK